MTRCSRMPVAGQFHCMNCQATQRDSAFMAQSETPAEVGDQVSRCIGLSTCRLGNISPCGRPKKVNIIQKHGKIASNDDTQEFPSLGSVGFRHHLHGCHQKPYTDGGPNTNWLKSREPTPVGSSHAGWHTIVSTSRQALGSKRLFSQKVARAGGNACRLVG